MSVTEWAIVVVPIVAFTAVGTVWQMRRWVAARRYLSSTLGCAPWSTGAGEQRVVCGINVLRPGRLTISYPLCKVEVLPEALVVFGPTGRRLAEFYSSAEYVSVLTYEPPFPPLIITTREAKVVLYVRRSDEPRLHAWLTQVVPS